MIRTRLVVDPSKTFLTLANDIYVSKSLEIYGEWSHAEVELMAQLLRRNDNVVEVGANIGAHTAFIAKDICAEGKVYAFEPRRIIFQFLCANIALNGLNNVFTYNVALSDAADEFRERDFINDASVNAGGVALGDAPGADERIIVNTLDSYLADLPKISLLKADVEGFEQRVLLGAKRLIERDRPPLYLENDRPDRSEALITYILSLDYDIWWHVVPLFRPNNRSATAANVFGNVCSCNILCLPRERKFQLNGFMKVTDPKDHPLLRANG